MKNQLSFLVLSVILVSSLSIKSLENLAEYQQTLGRIYEAELQDKKAKWWKDIQNFKRNHFYTFSIQEKRQFYLITLLAIEKAKLKLAGKLTPELEGQFDKGALALCNQPESTILPRFVKPAEELMRKCGINPNPVLVDTNDYKEALAFFTILKRAIAKNVLNNLPQLRSKL